MVKVLFALTYYRPHVSGLTIYVERLAQVMAENATNIHNVIFTMSEDVNSIM